LSIDVAIMYSKTDKELNNSTGEAFVLVVVFYYPCTSFSRSKGIWDL